MVVNYKLIYTKQAQKDAKKINEVGLKNKVIRILTIFEKNPFSKNLRYEKLIGDLEGAYSRRINIKHRLVYQVLENEKIVKIIRMWTHYD